MCDLCLGPYYRRMKIYRCYTDVVTGSNVLVQCKRCSCDAVGMKMMSKGIENPLAATTQDVSFGYMRILSLTCNYWTEQQAAQFVGSADGGRGLSA